MSDNWEQKVRKGLVCAGIDDVTAHKIPIEPAGHYLIPHLPDRILAGISVAVCSSNMQKQLQISQFL